MFVAAPTPTAPTKPDADDEENFLDELPPMDGGADDDPAALAEDGDDDVDDVNKGDISLDDAAFGGDPGEALDVDDGGGRGESGYLDDAADAEGLDVGESAMEFREGERLLDDGDAPGVGDEDFGLVGERDLTGLDQGEEGPDTADEDLREDELPRLDADDEGDGEDAPPAEVDVSAMVADDVQHPWDDRAWQRVGVPLRVGPMSAVASIGGSVIAGGRVLASVEASGKCELIRAAGLAGGATIALAAQPGVLVVSTEQGGVFVSRDVGATFHERNRWRSIAAPGEVRRLAALALTQGSVWGVTRSGRLLRGEADGDAWEEPIRSSRVAAVCAATRDRIVALTLPSPAGTVAAVRGAAGELVLEELPALPRGLRVPAGAPFAAASGSLAFAVEGVGVLRSTDGGAWERIEGTGDASALAFLDEHGTLMIAIHDVGDERSWLLRAPQGAPPRIVAEVGAESDDPEGTGRVGALAWDESARVVWVAGTFGLVAFRPT